MLYTYYVPLQIVTVNKVAKHKTKTIYWKTLNELWHTVILITHHVETANLELSNDYWITQLLTWAITTKKSFQIVALKIIQMILKRSQSVHTRDLLKSRLLALHAQIKMFLFRWWTF